MATRQTWASALFVAATVIALTAIIAAATKYPGPWGAAALLLSARRATPRLVIGALNPSTSYFEQAEGRPQVQDRPCEDARNVSARLVALVNCQSWSAFSIPRGGARGHAHETADAVER